MNLLLCFFPCLFITGCNLTDPSEQKSGKIGDTSIWNNSTDTLAKQSTPTKEDVTIGDTTRRKVDTALLMKRSEEILGHIKNDNYKKFATYIDPQGSIRFSPYAFIDTARDRNLSAHQFLQLVQQPKKINWHSGFDEKPERLTVKEYFKKYVYDVDFLNAELKSINQYHSQGTDLNNIMEAYPGCDVVEFFFPGFEKKYEGLDFRALRLVYRSRSNQLFLAGVVHDKWTP